MDYVSDNIDRAVAVATKGIERMDDNRLSVRKLLGTSTRVSQYFFWVFLDDVVRPLGQCTVSTLRRALQNKRALGGKVPVVVVNEVGNNRTSQGAIVDADVVRVRYIRNLCRAMHVPRVLMGTTSNAMNMIQASSGSGVEAAVCGGARF